MVLNILDMDPLFLTVQLSASIFPAGAGYTVTLILCASSSAYSPTENRNTKWKETSLKFLSKILPPAIPDNRAGAVTSLGLKPHVGDGNLQHHTSLRVLWPSVPLLATAAAVIIIIVQTCCCYLSIYFWEKALLSVLTCHREKSSNPWSPGAAWC